MILLRAFRPSCRSAVASQGVMRRRTDPMPMCGKKAAKKAAPKKAAKKTTKKAKKARKA